MPTRTNEVQSKKIIELEIVDLSLYGSGVARLENQVVFVPNALPHETHNVIVEHNSKTKKSSFLKAQSVSVLSASPDRTLPTCKLFGQCGGCQLQHLLPAKAMNYKFNWFMSQLKKIGKLSEPQLAWFEKNTVQTQLSQTNYRQRVKFHVENGVVGFYKPESHTVLKVENCSISSEGINSLLPHLQTFASKLKTNFPKKTFLLEVTEESQNIVSLTVPGNSEDKTIEQLQTQLELFFSTEFMSSLKYNYTLKFKWKNKGSTQVFEHPHILQYLVHSSNFVQPHKDAMTYYAQWIEKAAQEHFLMNIMNKPRNLDVAICWDLFAGSGAFSFAFSTEAQRQLKNSKTYSVEGMGNCQESAKQNAKLFCAHNISLKTESKFEIIGADVHKFLADAEKNVDYELPEFVVCDPPRDGLGIESSKILAHLLLHQAQQLQKAITLVMVFCDSASFARDVSVFLQVGFKLQKSEVVDAFGQTTHMEVLAVLAIGD